MSTPLLECDIHVLSLPSTKEREATRCGELVVRKFLISLIRVMTYDDDDALGLMKFNAKRLSNEDLHMLKVFQFIIGLTLYM